MTSKRPTGMAGFTIFWLGQIVSLLGSAMTWFALTIWAWEKTGKASALATISFFAFLPTGLLTPMAGAFVEGDNLAIWQSKLEADVQGRVFSARQLLVQLPYLFGILLSGYLAEAWAIPSALIFAGIAGAIVFVFGCLSAYVRAAETLLPDPMESL